MQKKYVCLNGKWIADYTFTDAYDYKTHRSSIPVEAQKRFDAIYLGPAIMPEIHFPEAEGSSGSSSDVAGLGPTTGNGLDGNTELPPSGNDSAGSSVNATVAIPADPNAPIILVKVICQTGFLKGEAHYHNLFVTGGKQTLHPHPKKLKKTPLVPHGFVAKLGMARILLDVVKTLEKIYDPEMLLLDRWKGFRRAGGEGMIDGALTIGEVSKEAGATGKVLVLVPVLGKGKENQEPGQKNGETTRFPDADQKGKSAILNQPPQKGILYEYPDSEEKIMGGDYENLFWGVNATATQQETAGGNLSASGSEELGNAPPGLDPGILAVLEPFDVLFGGPGFGNGGLDMIM